MVDSDQDSSGASQGPAREVRVRLPPADSPLRRRYPSLDLGQRLVLPVVVLAIDVTLTTYLRLVETLMKSTRDNGQGPIIDAWAIVDWSHRLRVVISQMPGLKQKAPAVEILKRALAPTEDFRHSFQHLEERLTEMEGTGGHSVGTLGWVLWEGPPSKEFQISVWIPTSNSPFGQNASPPFGFPNPLADVAVEPPIGRVTLYFGRHEVDLTKVVRAVERFAERFEQEVADKCSSLDPVADHPTKVRLFRPQ